MKCSWYGLKQAVGFGASAMFSRTSFTSPKIYFTKDIVDDSFVPKNRKPKPISKPAAKPASKPAPKGKHVQLFQMKRKVGKGFYSIPVDGQ